MPDWKKCSEEMPEIQTEVIAWDGEFRHIAFCSVDGSWCLSDAGWTDPEITHWLPLPAPPEEEK